MTQPQKEAPKSSSLYRSVTHWSSLIKTSREAQREPENRGDQTVCPPSLLPHILLCRNNRDYKWPQQLKLSQEPLTRAPRNTRSLENYPNLLKDPDELEDPFLLAQTDLEDHTPTKEESMPPSSMLFGNAPNEEEEVEEAEDLLKIMTQTMDLPTMSPMEQTSRTTSLSRQSMTLKPWDLSLKSSTETEPELTHSSQSS
jgi:hypothetical protein